MEEYKREKRRAIPSWSQSLAYSKFKADLFSWDQEHHLSAGSVKFGILAEILKSQGRISTYEQIQARLGKTRNEANIINQIVALLVYKYPLFKELLSNFVGETGMRWLAILREV